MVPTPIMIGQFKNQSDIHVPNTEGIPLEDEYVNLILQMNSLDGGESVERECRIDAGHSRKFVGAAGVGHGVGNRTWNNNHNNDNNYDNNARAI